MDEVDRLIAQWHSERPDLDVTPMEVMSRVDRLARHLDRDRRDAFSAAGLEPWEFDVLAALRRCGAPYQLSPGALARATLVTSGTMTNRVDRLSGRGLVVRDRDPEDGRGVLVRLSATGRTLVDRALVDLLQSETRALAPLAPAEQRHLATYLRRLLAPFEPPGTT